MESNEQDNRQMTVIAEAITEIRTGMFSKRDCDRSEFCRGFRECAEATIERLESLLPKEEEQLVNMAVLAYTHQCGNIPFPLENRAAVLFNETFKQG